jgi:hypothetical protein
LQLRSLHVENTADGTEDELSVGEAHYRVCRPVTAPSALGQPSADGNGIDGHASVTAHLEIYATETRHWQCQMVGMHACTECRDCTLPPFFLFFRSDSPVQIYASDSKCKDPGSHCVKPFSALPSHS